MRRLLNTSRDYDWGSSDDIPQFLREPTDGRPVAEVWIGTHPLGMSVFSTEDGEAPLSSIAGELPFMLKLLAASRPLSIQVHPNAQQAAAGFAREEADGVPIDAPSRIYRDAHHKPEMVYALTTFDTLVGFRPTAEILRILSAIESPLAGSLAESLNARPGFSGIVRLVEMLLEEKPDVAEIDRIVTSCRDLAAQGIDIKRAYVTAVEIAAHHPGDVGVVISLLLNRLTLQPGEAAFLGAGIIHAHLHGMCLEVMVSSDNVLRAGLTSKHLDPLGLVSCLDKGMSRLARVTPEQFGFSTDVFSPAVDEFALAITQCSPSEPEGALLPDASRRVVVCTGGEVEMLNEHGERMTLLRGESLYADASDGVLRGIGTGELAQAYAPTDETPDAALTDLV
ncbi:MAG: mannose-6-phosphate isomerase, class I [Aeromicrobium sp.]